MPIEICWKKRILFIYLFIFDQLAHHLYRYLAATLLFTPIELLKSLKGKVRILLLKSASPACCTHFLVFPPPSIWLSQRVENKSILLSNHWFACRLYTVQVSYPHICNERELPSFFSPSVLSDTFNDTSLS